MNLFSIPPDAPFLEMLAAEWLAAGAEPWRGLILLPTRRAARALADAFLRANHGTAILLPRIVALAALDEAPLALAGELDLPPAIGAVDRLAALSALILRLPPEDGGARTADGAWMLARELAALMDEAEREETHLPSALANIAAAEHAQHWNVTLKFLGLITQAWPLILAERGMMNPAARQAALLRAQAEILVRRAAR